MARPAGTAAPQQGAPPPAPWAAPARNKLRPGASWGPRSRGAAPPPPAVAAAAPSMQRSANVLTAAHGASFRIKPSFQVMAFGPVARQNGPASGATSRGRPGLPKQVLDSPPLGTNPPPSVTSTLRQPRQEDQQSRRTRCGKLCSATAAQHVTAPWHRPAPLPRLEFHKSSCW